MSKTARSPDKRPIAAFEAPGPTVPPQIAVRRHARAIPATLHAFTLGIDQVSAKTVVSRLVQQACRVFGIEQAPIVNVQQRRIVIQGNRIRCRCAVCAEALADFLVRTDRLRESRNGEKWKAAEERGDEYR